MKFGLRTPSIKRSLKAKTTGRAKRAIKKALRKMPVKINGEDFTFSPGKHSQLQKAIIEEFAPRFALNSECLYVGDTTEKDLVKNVDKLRALGFEITSHDKMPDVVLYSEDKDWLYFIESVTSVGPMEPKRIKEIEEMTTGVMAGKRYMLRHSWTLRHSSNSQNLLHGKQRFGLPICQIT